jgi:serine/threonine protein kinase/tetratricopeptide (TPR) repeat protein
MIGRTLSHYRIEENLGEGGMGTVYRARDVRLDRNVAIKVLRVDAASDPERQKRFVREAKAASALNHPNIVTIYDIDRADGNDFIAMEYIQGNTLASLIGRKGVAPCDALIFAVDIVEALAAAHAAGIVHRDIKPTNIMVNDKGRVKVLDFGLAKLTEPVSADNLGSAQTSNFREAPQTAEGTIVGTVAYMSPEQAEGKPVDSRSDIFSFGAVLYELISGRRAFQGETTVSTLAAILREEPKPLRAMISDVPSELEKIISRCLRKDPNRRFHHMVDLRVSLEEVLSDLRNLAEQGEASAREEHPGAEASPSIAVLPFADMSPQKDQEYFCDGITEELINALAKVEGLRVAARTSAFQFKGKAEDIGKIGTQLKVRMVLEGSVRKAGDRLRVTAQLINVADGYHLWSERYDREMKDVFAIQDEIARAVVDTLKIKLFGEVGRQLVKRYTEDLEAYDLYLRGHYYWNKWHSEAARKGIEYFERAIGKDPNYAPAYARLAECLACLGYWGISTGEVWKKAKTAAVKALEIDDTLAEAHVSLGVISSLCDWKWSEADKEFKRAIELNPGLAGAHSWYAVHLPAVGRLDEALAEAKVALRLDPLSMLTNGGLGSTLYIRREYDQAVDQLQKTLELDPANPRVYYYLGRSYIGKAMLEDASAALQRGSQSSGGDLRLLGVLGHCYALMRRRREAEKLLDELKSRQEPSNLAPFSLALIYVGFGDTGEAFLWLEKALEERSGGLRYLKVDPLLDSLRPNPRFNNLVERMGLPR